MRGDNEDFGRASSQEVFKLAVRIWNFIIRAGESSESL